MITTVTLNASIDKAYRLEGDFQPGQVMRVKETRNTAGGKGLNVARVVQLCQEEVLATGFVGGFNGRYLEFLLKEDGIASRFTPIAGETRSCINVLDTAFGSTELLEAGCQVTEEEVAVFLEQYTQLLEETDVVTLSGSLPQGVPVSIYAQLVELAHQAGKQVILDSSGQSFQEGLKAKPTLVKPNQDEIQALFGVSIETVEDTIAYARQIAAQGAQYVVVSLGGDGALMVTEEAVYHARPPKITPVNTVGCGDSMVAALAVGLKRGHSPQECLTFAVAVGTANALTHSTGHFRQEDLDGIYPEVTVETLA